MFKKKYKNKKKKIVPHLLPPQRDRHQLPGHVHEMEGPLGHLSVGPGGEAGGFVHALAHADHICKAAASSHLQAAHQHHGAQKVKEV